MIQVFYNLNLLYSDLGKAAEAEAMYQRALAGKEKVLGPEHPSTLMTVNNLGSLYKKVAIGTRLVDIAVMAYPPT